MPAGDAKTKLVRHSEDSGCDFPRIFQRKNPSLFYESRLNQAATLTLV